MLAVATHLLLRTMRKSTRQAAKRAAKARLSGGISSESPKNKKIVFGEDDDVDAPIDDLQHDKEDEVNVNRSTADEGVVDTNNNDVTTDKPDIDDDTVEEVKGSSARESTQRLRDEERKVAKESTVSKKRRKKKNVISIEEQVDDSKEEEDESSDDSEEDGDDEDMLTESFFEMVDSERATQIQLTKKEKKEKKIQQRKRLGKHTTFVVEDEYKMGGDTPHRTDQTNIEVVPIGGGIGADSNNETSSNTTNVDEERQLIISATLGSKPSKSATLFARGSLTCGVSKERGSDSRKRKSKNEETWKRSKKLKRLGVGSRPGQAATLFVCKKKKKRW